jgi:hypothetical protein
MSRQTQPPTITIEKKLPESEVYDVMGSSARWEVKIHEHGLVALLDVMPRFAPVGKTADFAIVLPAVGRGRPPAESAATSGSCPCRDR